VGGPGSMTGDPKEPSLPPQELSVPSPADRRIREAREVDALHFTPDGLIPVVVQAAGGGEVLMVAWAHREALLRSLETGEMHFWSRSRGELWRKGATSGNTQRLLSLHADCDGDTVLARVESAGPACHTGDLTCFGERAGGGADPTLHALWQVLEARNRERPEGSYTTRLLTDENLRLKKLGEETAELIHALARGGPRERIREEGADLLYHLLVALLGAGVSLGELAAELDARRG